MSRHTNKKQSYFFLFNSLKSFEKVTEPNITDFVRIRRDFKLRTIQCTVPYAPKEGDSSAAIEALQEHLKTSLHEFSKSDLRAICYNNNNKKMIVNQNKLSLCTLFSDCLKFRWKADRHNCVNTFQLLTANFVQIN